MTFPLTLLLLGREKLATLARYPKPGDNCVRRFPGYNLLAYLHLLILRGRIKFPAKIGEF